MKAILREEYKAVLKQLKYLSAVDKIVDRLGWDRLRVVLILDELTKTGFTERINAESYKLTSEGEKVLERIEAEEHLAELPTAFSPKTKPKIIRPEDWVKEWKKKWSYK